MELSSCAERIRETRRKLERDLAAVLAAFTAETSLRVTAVEVEVMRRHDDLPVYTVEVRTEL